MYRWLLCKLQGTHFLDGTRWCVAIVFVKFVRSFLSFGPDLDLFVECLGLFFLGR